MNILRRVYNSASPADQPLDVADRRERLNYKHALKSTLLFSIAILTACTAIKKLPAETLKPLAPLTPKINTLQTEASVKPQKSANVISSWEISGAIAARNQRKSWTASLNWLQQGADQYQIRLFGPLGGGTVIVEKQGSVITYRDGPKKITSSNADRLLLQQTGVRLPVNSLYYWVRGIPVPGPVGAEKYVADHLLSLLQQNGFKITYSQYTTVNGINLPSKIRLEGSSVLIKLVIKHWKI